MAKRPKTLLTVDWDAFVPVGHAGDDMRWDISHAETKFHLNALWQTRGGLMELMKVDPDLAQPFWPAMGRLFQDLPRFTLVSDSHMYAYNWLDDIQTVVLVDAHHDCWSGQAGAVDCSNWARRWLDRNPKRHMHWLVPGWVDTELYESDWVRFKQNQVSIHILDDVLHAQDIEGLPKRVDRVHVCRSGCWTPPWLDQAFIDWLKAGNRDCMGFPVDEKGTDWDALRLRWSEHDYAAMRQLDQMLLDTKRRVSVG